MSRIIHRSLRHDYPVAVKGHGVFIEDANGKSYIDASGGAAVSCLGHGHPEVLAAMHGQLDALAYAHTSFFTTEAAEQLADRLIDDAPAGMGGVYFCGSGSEAVEACLKMARHYFVEKGEMARTKIISRWQSYHGITLGALAVGGRRSARTPFADMLFDVEHVSCCNTYRDRLPNETPEAYGERLAAELEDTVKRLGPGNVAAFIAETVVGATIGAMPAVPGYFRRIREICDRHGILLILDEVMCGMGRTGTLYACEQEGVTPDLIAIAKGLGGGYAPIGAMIAHERIIAAIEAGSGAFPHSQTYIGHPVSCAAALAVQTIIKRDNLLANVREQGAYLARRLAERFGNHHHVGDIRGRGLFQAIELVTDRDSKTPFAPSLNLHARIKKAAMARGLMVYPMGGSAGEAGGDHVLLAPPFITDAATIDTIVERLGEAVDAAIAQAA